MEKFSQGEQQVVVLSSRGVLDCFVCPVFSLLPHLCFDQTFFVHCLLSHLLFRSDILLSTAHLGFCELYAGLGMFACTAA